MGLSFGLGLPPAPKKGVGGWTPNRLFGAGEAGDWWSCAARSSTFQNSAATTPAGDGDPVGGLVGQKNGNVLTQGTTAKKPTLHLGGGLWWITTDGVDDFLAKSFTLDAPITRISAIQQVSWTGGPVLLDGGAALAQLYQQTSSPRVTMWSSGNGPTTTELILGENHVVTEVFNGASSKIAVDNNAYNTGNPGTLNPGGLTIGASRVGSSAAGIQYFGGLVINRVLTDPEIALARKWAGALAGLSL